MMWSLKGPGIWLLKPQKKTLTSLGQDLSLKGERPCFSFLMHKKPNGVGSVVQSEACH